MQRAGAAPTAACSSALRAAACCGAEGGHGLLLHQAQHALHILDSEWFAYECGKAGGRALGVLHLRSGAGWWGGSRQA